MGRPHLLVVPYPAQGHVMPLMQLSHNLVDRGFKITFVNSERTHKRVVATLSNGGVYEDYIHLVSIPDGMGEDEVPKDRFAELTDLMRKVMPVHLEELIRNINRSNNGNDRITCVIADEHAGWALEVAKKMLIPTAAFWPCCAAGLAANLHIPKLIEEGIITSEGIPIKDTVIQLSPTMPAMNTSQLPLPWLTFNDTALETSVFNMLVANNRIVKLADYLICNSFYELEPAVFTLIPNLRPIGPLIASSRLAQFLPEESTCLNWLDQQEPHSVIYVAFGSTGVLDKRQFEELALGLELSGKPFLWVVRPDFIYDKATGMGTDTFLEGFEARVGSRGRMVGWAPQKEVLAHPAVACFMTHCGWNSTMEGISHGVPIICWRPFLYDQFANRSYICDVWKNGVGLDSDDNGLITREEIKTKLVGLLGNESIKASALRLKETAISNVSDGGTSFKNFETFVHAII